MWTRKTFLTVLLLSQFFMAEIIHAAPKEYILDTQHTHILWKVSRFGFSMTAGSFTDISGELILDEENPAKSSVKAIIKVSSVRSDLKEREAVVRGSFWLDAIAFPAINFQSNNVNLIAGIDGKQRAIVSGEMTMKGISAPMQMTVILNKTGKDPVTKRMAAGFSAKGSFSRSMFGVKTAVGPVGDLVEFEIETVALVAN